MGYIRIWATGGGQVMKIDASLRAEDITLNGVAISDIDLAKYGLDPDDASFILDFRHDLRTIRFQR